jgi:hypothetical protein
MLFRFVESLLKRKSKYAFRTKVVRIFQALTNFMRVRTHTDLANIFNLKNELM